MAALPGTRARQGASQLGRAARFAAWAGASLAIVAGAVLLPAYAKLARARYARQCLEAELASAEALIKAQDRLIEAARNDEVLVQRLARSQLGLLPQNELVAIDPAGPRPAPPGIFSPPPQVTPDPPPAWLMSVSARISRPQFRRGLMALAAGAMLAALFLTGPATPRTRSSTLR